MAFQDVYQLVDGQLFEGQTCLNVYFYQQRNVLAPSPTAEGLATEWIEQVLPYVADIQPNDVVHTNIQVRNLFNPSDTWETEISYPGEGGTGDLDPTFNAIGFVLNQNNGALRNGAKRYTGVQESHVEDGVITASGLITVLDVLADKLNDALTDGVIANSWIPVIVGRLLVGDEYVLPEILADAVLGDIIDAVWRPLITSQVSRKIGVGE